MDPIQIVLIALAAVGVWAVAELAITLRRARGAVDSIDRAVEGVNDVVTEARPVIAKLDGAIDDLAPALAQVEPLLKQAGVAVEALSADLIEVNGVLRDVSQVTGTVSTASGAVSGIADAASEKVQKLLGKKRPQHDAAVAAPAIESSDVDDEPVPEVRDSSEQHASRQYYTYVSTEGESDER